MSGDRQTTKSYELARQPGRAVLRTFGSLGLYRADGDKPILGPGKPFALLVYLNALPDHRASREYLISLLWSDLEPKAARHAVRQVIWQVRHTLGEQALTTHNDDVTLTVPLDSDRDRFLVAVEEGQFEEAATVYRGDFLPSFAISGGVEFDQWADAERQHLRHLFAHAAETLARAELARGHFTSARDLARRIRDSDPFDQRGWRLLLEACLSQSDSVSAMAEADRLEALLHAERRMAEPATRALLLRVRGGMEEQDAPETGVLLAELVGRESEFAFLLHAFERARRGALQEVALVAPAGLGKTRLLQELSRRLTAAGNTAAYVRAHPADRDVAWAYAAEVARELAKQPGAPGVSPSSAAALVALSPSLSSRFPVQADASAGDEARRRRAAALAELIEAVSDDRPLALLLDDLHWADALSRDALQRALAHLLQARVLVVLSSRPAEELRGERAGVLRLAPLTRDQISTLVLSLGSLPQAPWCDELPGWLEAATAGSPLLVLETLHHAIESGVLDRSEGTWTCTDERELLALLEAGSALSRRIEHLDRSQGWLLLLLAVAGAPRDVLTLSGASGSALGKAVEDLNDLERRGLVTRRGATWSVAHDEIAERAQERADPKQCGAAHGALGRTLLEHPRERATVRAAAHHLASASLKPDLIRAARAWVLLSRRTGDDRSPPELLTELMGSALSDGELLQLVRALPWRLRVRPKQWWTGAAVAALAIVALIAALPRDRSDQPSLTLARWIEGSTGEWQLSAHELTRQDLAAGVVTLSSFRPTGLFSPHRPEGLIRPGAPETLASTGSYPDSGGLDVVMTSRGDTQLRRLTNRKGDDFARAWSPDGRYLVIATDRWAERSRSDLALIEPDRPEALPVRLTADPSARDESALWSPDGTRIAFARASYGQPPHAVCIVTVDGRSEWCLDVPGQAAQATVGWINAVDLVAVFTDQHGVERLLAVNTVGGRFRELAEGTIAAASQASGWIACFCRRSAAEPYQTLVFSPDRPDRVIRVEPAGAPPGLILFPSRKPLSYLDRLEIQGAQRPIPMDGAYRLSLVGWDAAGRPIEPLAIRWSSTDTAVATVDGAGTVRPRREGRTTVSATAGGWRTTSAEITIGPAETATQVVEDWREGISDDWVPFGEPLPFATESDRGFALAPNGDSTFSSGVFLKGPLAVGAGVGVEVDLSTPLTSLVWQNVSVALWPADRKYVNHWDLARGDLLLPDQTWRECRAYYPATESAPGQLALGLAAGIVRTVAVSPTMQTGRWTRLRLQLFPDGRCGVAVDGTARAIVDRRIALGDSVLVLLYSYSHGTRILVGPVEVWTGVRRDVDWDRVVR